MYTLLIILTLLCAVLLICVVLVQKSKGGGLSSSFAGYNQIMGVRGTNTAIEKLTWGLAGAIVVLAVCCTFAMPKAIVTKSRVQAPAAAEQTVPADFNTPVAAPAPAATPAPAAETPAPATEEPAAEESEAGH